MSKEETVDPALHASLALRKNPLTPAGVTRLLNTVRALTAGAAKDSAPSPPERVVTPPPPSRLRIPCARCGKYAWSAERNPGVRRYENELRLFRAIRDRPRPPRPICPECRAKEKGK